VLLIHGLAQIVDHTVYSAGAILIVVLVALALGAAVVSVTARWFPARPLLVAALFAEAALLFWLPSDLERQTALGSLGRDALFDGLRIATLHAGPVLLVGALVLPLTFRLGAGGPVGARLGALLAVNTVGGIAGSIVAGFFLLGGLGLWRSIAALALAYAVLGVLALRGFRARVVAGVACAGVAVAGLASGANPFRLPVAWPGGAKLLAVEESPYGVISVVEGGGVRFMKLNNHYTLSG
jgi:spermidine synthase